MNHDVHAGIVAGLFPHADLDRVVRLTGGVSADVHRLDLKLTDGSTTSLVLRAHRESHSGHAAGLEYQLWQALHGRGLAVPEPLLVDVSGSRLPDPYLLIEFIEGTSEIPIAQQGRYIDLMADTLATIHALPTVDLPTLPMRIDPLPELFDYLPQGDEWNELRAFLHSLSGTSYREQPKLLHGDFWPENLLWRAGTLAAILDWEDAALGDPLSDVACSRLELRYKFGTSAGERFTRAYARHCAVDEDRLALWQVYVAAAAQQFMGSWGLDSALETHMRTEALDSIREAGEALMGQKR
jgi:aminoglycoside phosphotransferase (APT) family kinase protein